jgi:phosphonoacetaldehyde hydrolase
MDVFTYSRRYRGSLKAAVLDWAGTTVDHGCRAPAFAFVELFGQWNVPITVAEARAPMGAHKKDHIREVAAMPDVAERWERAYGKPCSEADVEAMFREFEPLQLACLRDYAELIPGVVEAVDAFRERGLGIGTTTGYTRPMLDLLLKEAAERGYEPDSSVCSTDVAAGRPAPWMIYRNAESLDAFPREAIVKIGDTPSDVAAGLNAGVWTVALTETGNETGLDEEALAALPPDERSSRLERAHARLSRAGAHFVRRGLAECADVVDEINERLSQGERP